MNVRPKVPGEGILLTCMVVALISGLIAPLFGDDPKAVAIPFLNAAFIAVCIGWLRSRNHTSG